MDYKNDFNIKELLNGLLAIFIFCGVAISIYYFLTNIGIDLDKQIEIIEEMKIKEINIEELKIEPKIKCEEEKGIYKDFDLEKCICDLSGGEYKETMLCRGYPPGCYFYYYCDYENIIKI